MFHLQQSRTLYRSLLWLNNGDSLYSVCSRAGLYKKSLACPNSGDRLSIQIIMVLNNEDGLYSTCSRAVLCNNGQCA